MGGALKAYPILKTAINVVTILFKSNREARFLSLNSSFLIYFN